MGTLFTIQPEDREPIEFTHFDCWDEDTQDEDIIEAWEKNLGIKLPKSSWNDVILSLLRQGFDVYEGDEFIEIFQSEEE